MEDVEANFTVRLELYWLLNQAQAGQVERADYTHVVAIVFEIAEPNERDPSEEGQGYNPEDKKLSKFDSSQSHHDHVSADTPMQL